MKLLTTQMKEMTLNRRLDQLQQAARVAACMQRDLLPCNLGHIPLPIDYLQTSACHQIGVHGPYIFKVHAVALS